MSEITFQISQGRSLRVEIKPMPYFVYILECKDTSLYAGCTNNLEKRLTEHNSSKNGAHYTKIRRPVVLKYSEKLPTLAAARRREAELKRLPREKKLDLIKNI
jgi:putative endonuclease